MAVGRFLIVEARFYQDVADHLVAGALAAIEASGHICDRVAVPGALEIPSAINIAYGARQHYYKGYIALGCVIRGETSHYDYVCEESARGLQYLALNKGLDIGNGILTTETKKQALVRADPAQKNKGADAANAVLSLYNLRHYLKGAEA